MTISRQQQEKANKRIFDSAIISMRPVYRKQKAALNSFHAVVGMLYIHYAINGLLKPDNVQTRAIMAEIDPQLKRMYNDLGSNEVETVTDILQNGVEDMYKQYSDMLQTPELAQPSQNAIDSIINTPIDGTLFSDRIWKNKEDLIKQLRKAISDIMQGKTTIDQAGKAIENIFNVSAYQSKRLLETELTRTQAQSVKNIAQIMGAKKVMWSATFENSCKHCMELDGKIFDIDKAPDIPQHPNCACMILLIFK